jgi:hypothetical protein
MSLSVSQSRVGRFQAFYPTSRPRQRILKILHDYLRL